MPSRPGQQSAAQDPGSLQQSSQEATQSFDDYQKMPSHRSQAQSLQASEMEESLENDVQDIIDRYLNEQPPSEATFQCINQPHIQTKHTANEGQSEDQPENPDDGPVSASSSQGQNKLQGYASPLNLMSHPRSSLRAPNDTSTSLVRMTSPAHLEKQSSTPKEGPDPTGQAHQDTKVNKFYEDLYRM